MPRPKSTDTEATRLAIAAAAEDLFRTVGYSKTTLSDVAARLGMSPANIYRFFRSKLEINGFICDRLIMEYEHGWTQAIIPGASAKENLTRYLVGCHRHTRENYLSNTGVYDMVAAAIEQNWPVMLKHMQRMTEFIAALVRSGVERGEFAPCDADRVAMLCQLSMHSFLDPRRIARTMADCAELGVEERMEADLRGVITLLLRGLSPQLQPITL